MKTSEQINELATALAVAQSKIKPPAKNRTAKVPMKNGSSYEYSYADLADIIEAIREPLSTNGLAITSGTESNGHTVLCTRLIHKSGQWIEASYPILDGLSAQQIGSAITYGRRYTTCALLGIVAEDDDDGASADEAPKKPAKAQEQKKDYKLKDIPNGAGKPQDEDRVPSSVTDAAAPNTPLVVPDDNSEAVVLKAYSKEKVDKKGNQYRGVLIVHSDNTEKWWNLYNAEAIASLPSMKGQLVQATLEMKGEYPLCHKLEAANG